MLHWASAAGTTTIAITASPVDIQPEPVKPPDRTQRYQAEYSPVADIPKRCLNLQRRHPVGTGKSRQQPLIQKKTADAHGYWRQQQANQRPDPLDSHFSTSSYPGPKRYMATNNIRKSKSYQALCRAKGADQCLLAQNPYFSASMNQ